MNTTFWTWFAVAAAVGGVLLFLLTAQVEVEVGTVPEESVTEPVAVESSVSYWQPAERVPSAVLPPASYAVPTQPCGSCGGFHPSTLDSPACPGAGQPVPCTTCGARMPMPENRTPCSSVGASPCSHWVPSPCAGSPCSGLAAGCGTPCASTCPLDKPGINRNMKLCVDECSFLQMHTTMPHPICADVRFDWSASKGSFLDSSSPDPVFYAPTTHFSDGEDIWIVLTITDRSGARYTDQLKLHVADVR